MPVQSCYDIEGVKEKEQYYNMSLQEWNCLDFTNFTFGGFWDGQFVRGISLNTEICLNKTDSDVICASEAEMKKQFSDPMAGSNLFYSWRDNRRLTTRSR